MLGHLRALELALGPAPRSVDAGLRTAFVQEPPPDWLAESRKDPLHRQWSDQEALLRTGVPTIGRIFAASTSLWEPGSEGGRVYVAYTSDPLLLGWSGRLEVVGEALFAFSEGASEPRAASRSPWLRQVLEERRTGRESVFHRPVPPSMTWGHPVWFSTAVLSRSELPGGVLRSLWQPLLVPGPESETPICLPIPPSMWPEGLLRAVGA